MEFLKGKKTYIVAALIGIATAAQALGYITAEQYQVIIALLGGTGLATLRAGTK